MSQRSRPVTSLPVPPGSKLTSPHTGLPVPPGSDLEAILTVGELVQQLSREVEHIKALVVRIVWATERAGGGAP